MAVENRAGIVRCDAMRPSELVKLQGPARKPDGLKKNANLQTSGFPAEPPS
jgi:hypothetical protein